MEFMLGSRRCYSWMIADSCAIGKQPYAIAIWKCRIEVGPNANCMLASSMALDTRVRRRWVGGAMLLAALGMLIAGETILEHHLRGVAFLFYWLLCLLLTGAAIIVAYLDARSVQQRSRVEARELLEKTIHKIESDVQQAPRRNGDNGRK